MAQEDWPFWRLKKKLFRQIKDERRVVVAVKREEGGDRQKFRMVGVGAVRAPIEFAVSRVNDFERLKEVSSYFKEVKHRPKKRQIYIVLEALGYQARLLTEYKWQKQKESGVRQMDWKVVWGPFQGMVGHFQLKSLGERQTEVSLWSVFSSQKIPLPAFFLRITLEVIAEKVAQKMRSYIEKEYRAQEKQSKQGKVS